MADERDPKLSKHYRELEPLEPPAALDQKILAAAREATESHAPLVVPAGRHRWHYSLAAAAVLVFAVALTLHLDRERPDPEAMPSVSVRGEIKQASKPEPAPRVEPQRQPAFTPDPQAGVPREAAATRPSAPPPRADEQGAQAERLRAERSAAATDAMRAQASAEARAARDMATNAEKQAANAELQAATAKRQAAASRIAAAPSAGSLAAAPENPERWLERIAELRSRGRHADADRELANFRKAYPNYPLSNVMRERVEGTSTPSQ